MNAHVTPKTGYYLVCTVEEDVTSTHQVSKEKLCTCGGQADEPCPHIQAVSDYLRQGGHRAALSPTCPICSAPVKHLGPDFWRCSQDNTHYWQWRGERNGGAVRKFLTQPHPAKLGAFYEQTIEEREVFLIEAARRMRAGGYTPYL
jgi:hypothetical protein